MPLRLPPGLLRRHVAHAPLPARPRRQPQPGGREAALRPRAPPLDHGTPLRPRLDQVRVARDRAAAAARGPRGDGPARHQTAAATANGPGGPAAAAQPAKSVLFWSDPFDLVLLNRLKLITRSRMNDFLVSVLTGILRQYLQHKGRVLLLFYVINRVSSIMWSHDHQTIKATNLWSKKFTYNINKHIFETLFIDGHTLMAKEPYFDGQ